MKLKLTLGWIVTSFQDSSVSSKVIWYIQKQQEEMLVQQITGTVVVWKGHSVTHPNLPALLNCLVGILPRYPESLVKFMSSFLKKLVRAQRLLCASIPSLATCWVQSFVVFQCRFLLMSWRAAVSFTRRWKLSSPPRVVTHSESQVWNTCVLLKNGWERSCHGVGWFCFYAEWEACRLDISLYQLPVSVGRTCLQALFQIFVLPVPVLSQVPCRDGDPAPLTPGHRTRVSVLGLHSLPWSCPEKGVSRSKVKPCRQEHWFGVSAGVQGWKCSGEVPDVLQQGWSTCVAIGCFPGGVFELLWKL